MYLFPYYTMVILEVQWFIGIQPKNYRYLNNVPVFAGGYLLNNLSWVWTSFVEIYDTLIAYVTYRIILSYFYDKIGPLELEINRKRQKVTGILL